MEVRIVLGGVKLQKGGKALNRLQRAGSGRGTWRQSGGGSSGQPDPNPDLLHHHAAGAEVFVQLPHLEAAVGAPNVRHQHSDVGHGCRAPRSVSVAAAAALPA